jgi:hypothetical protein
MTTMKQIIFASGLVFALLAIAAAQESTSTTAQTTSLTITAAASGERVRITAPSSVVQMHVEVYAASGEKLFDQEIRGGNVFDWHLQDGQAQRLAPGNYVCVVTAKSISGKLTQKIGTVSVEEKSVSVQPAESQQLSAPQAQTIGPVEENSSWTIPTKDEPQTPTVIANDGTDGQMIRGRGALTFRIGNFFSGVDQEQMRLTEEGSLGIGTSEPKAKLDVAGTIRAERFLVAKPKLAGVDKTDTLAADAVDLVQPLIAGTGTLNHIAKWTPDGSTLGDSGIFETAVGGLVGIGTASPNAKLTVNANSGIPPIAPLGVIAHFVNANENNTFLTADSYGNANLHSDFLFRRARGTMAAPTAVQANDIIGQIQARGYGATGFAATARSSIRLAAAENWTDSAQGAYVSFFTTPNLSTTIAERLRISDAGNVGIGTAAPASKLDVAGDINTSTQYNIGGARVLFVDTFNTFVGLNQTSAGSDNSLFGSGAGGSTVGTDNSFFGVNAGLENTTGSRNTFIGEVAGEPSVAQSNNSTAIGFDAAVSNSNNSTAIGANALVTQSNSLVLGSIKNINFATADTNVGIGTTAPTDPLTIKTATNTFGFVQTDGTITVGSYVGGSGVGGWYGTRSPHPLHFFVNNGSPSMTVAYPSGFVGIGTTAPAAKLSVNGTGWFQGDNTPLSGSGVAVGFTTGNQGYVFALDYGANAARNLILNGPGGNVGIGTNSPDDALSVNGGADKSAGGGSWSFFSDERLKNIKGRFTPGLKAVMQLQPIRFEYKQDNAMGIKTEGEQIGFSAQSVQELIPEAVTKNDKGYLLVNNDPILWTMLNAIKEQQKEIEQQHQQIDALRKLVCRSHRLCSSMKSRGPGPVR